MGELMIEWFVVASSKKEGFVSIINKAEKGKSFENNIYSKS